MDAGGDARWPQSDRPQLITGPPARERAALGRLPYDEDPDLSWTAPDGPDLPYDGEIPQDALRLAERRRPT